MQKREQALPATTSGKILVLPKPLSAVSMTVRPIITRGIVVTDLLASSRP